MKKILLILLLSPLGVMAQYHLGYNIQDLKTIEPTAKFVGGEEPFAWVELKDSYAFWYFNDKAKVHNYVLVESANADALLWPIVMKAELIYKGFSVSADNDNVMFSDKYIAIFDKMKDGKNFCLIRVK